MLINCMSVQLLKYEIGGNVVKKRLFLIAKFVVLSEKQA